MPYLSIRLALLESKSNMTDSAVGINGSQTSGRVQLGGSHYHPHVSRDLPP
jgi:hypothetical protein